MCVAVIMADPLHYIITPVEGRRNVKRGKVMLYAMSLVKCEIGKLK